ncbi:MAG: tRNA (adenosine(37)-N6)-threonylcarbamoyltransferase complex ATPase subunit type 1 TsaE [Candidatus Buchananbacteria bacterium]
MRYFSKNAKETYNLGKKIALTLKGGEILALSGNLGAGKTVFSKGVAAGLGVKAVITSPTFVLMKIYHPKSKILTLKKFVHIDCYRVDGPMAIEGIGATDYFNQSDSVVLIEWAEKIKKILPPSAIKIKIKILKEDKREINIIK